MKQLVIFLLFMFSSLFAIGDTVISNKVVLENGDTVHANHMFELDDMPMFSLAKKGSVAMWSFAVWKEIKYASGPYVRTQKILDNVYSSLGFDSLFCVPLSSIKYGDNLCKFPSDSIRILKGVIFATLWDRTTDSIEVELNFLPAKPKISDVYLAYDYDWEYDCFNDGYLKIAANSKRVSKFGMELINCDRNCFEIPKDNGAYCLDFEGNEFMECLEVKNMYSHVFKIKNCDWGQAYKIFAVNDFGTTYNDEDIIFTTYYITDPLILARIDSLKKAETSNVVEIRKNCGIKIIVGKNIVSFTNDQNIFRVIVFDNVGKVCHSQKNGSSIDFRSWPSGLYIIKVYGNKNEILTAKFLKQ